MRLSATLPDSSALLAKNPQAVVANTRASKRRAYSASKGQLMKTEVEGSALRSPSPKCWRLFGGSDFLRVVALRRTQSAPGQFVWPDRCFILSSLGISSAAVRPKSLISLQLPHRLFNLLESLVPLFLNLFRNLNLRFCMRTQ
jgi:hypothetical protein